jgi:hypothetical protein
VVTHRSRRLHLEAVLLIECTLVLIGSSGAIAQTSAGRAALTVSDALKTTRVLCASSVQASASCVSVSPDRKRYVIGLIHSDLGRNGNILELLAGGLGSIERASTPATVAELFTHSLGSSYGYGATPLTLPGFQKLPTWIDNERVAFLWEGENGKVQVVIVNVRTHDVTYATHHATNIVRFDVSSDGTLIYSAEAIHSSGRSSELLRAGFAVTNPDLPSLLKGEADGYSTIERVQSMERFVLRPGANTPTRVEVAGESVVGNMSYMHSALAPNGRQAIIDWVPAQLPASWDAYRGSFLSRFIQRARGEGYNGSLNPSGIFEPVVVDLDSGASRPLWNVPMADWELRIAWASDSRRVVLGPTHLPVEGATSDRGLTGRSLAVVDIATGSWLELSLPKDFDTNSIDYLRWTAPGKVEVTNAGDIYVFTEMDGHWERTHRSSRLSRSDKSGDIHSGNIHIELRQDLNTPPTLWAVDPAQHREQLVRELNPALRTHFLLGRVEAVSWDAPDGRTWHGLLYYPVHFSPERRFPLVIQTHGFAPVSQFSLYGHLTGLGPSGGLDAAQPLANLDIAVLQLEDFDSSQTTETPAEPILYLNAYESAIEHFANSGLIDPNKVGLVGYSNTGWHVEYALTHSHVVFRAAIAGDNFDGGYWQSASVGWPSETADPIGAPAFGADLALWLERAPPFLAERVVTPLQLQIHSGGLAVAFGQWEMFSRLRRLNTPTELYLVPDIEHGSHGIQNPAQCLAALQRAVDWFNFWLNDREETDPNKAEQYAQWHHLREERDALLKKPRPPLLEWTAVPKPSM